MSLVAYVFQQTITVIEQNSVNYVGALCPDMLDHF